MLSKEERRLHASIAAHVGWAQTPDHTAAPSTAATAWTLSSVTI